MTSRAVVAGASTIRSTNTTRLRIAIYHNLHSGGARRVVADQVKHLRARHHVTVFSLTDADHVFGEDPGADPVDTRLFEFVSAQMAPSPFGRINPLIGLVNLAKMASTAKRVSEAIDDGNFDVVLVHPCQLTQTPLVLRWLQSPTVYYCHELPRRLYEPPIARPYSYRSRHRRLLDAVDPLPRLGQSVYRLIDRRSAQQADCIVTNSYYTAQNVMRSYSREALPCPPGVEAGTLRPAEVDRQRFVLSVGALTPLKGFDFIVRSIGTIPKWIRPPLLVVSNYEEAAEREYLRDVASAHDVALECRVAVPDSELHSLYSRSACVAVAPVSEPLGLVALEAMAAGAPIVGISEGGVRETIIHGETGCLMPRDECLFGQAIQAMIQDSGRASRMGAAGSRYVLERWNWDRRIQELENVLSMVARRQA